MRIVDLRSDDTAKAHTIFMVAVRETLNELVKDQDIRLGVIDLMGCANSDLIITPGEEGYRIVGVAYRGDKTKAVGFKKFFRAIIGVSTDAAMVQGLCNELAQDIILHLAPADL